MTLRGRLRLLAAAPLALMLGGCAAAAIPLLAGTVIARKEATRGEPKPEPTPSPKPVTPIVEVLTSDYSLPATGAQSATPPGLTPAALVTPAPPPASQPVTPELVPTAAPATPFAAAPPALASPGSYAAFASYAIARAVTPPSGTVRRSALVDQTTITSEPRFSDCGDSPPAVAIDLDKGGKPFDLADAPFPAPGLAEELARIRAAGITLLWSATLPVDSAQKLYTVLRASGLDPDRTDRLLLLRTADERKQLRRFAASRDWCIIAIAGDARGDFDELYDYLRDPSGPLAAALAPTFGDGWFLVPPPID